MQKINLRRHDLPTHAARLWNSGDQQLDTYNRQAWLKAIEYLGDQWILAEPRTRITVGTTQTGRA